MTERGRAAGRAGIAQIAIALVACAVVAMLIVPVPDVVLDVLLTANIGIAVALVMAAVFSPSPLGFVSFPTLLVVTTLFRVGLEVSMTRSILAHADAGSVVRAFGSSVVAANLVVGLVVFAVITIVQLIVVARGAERVAEVAARFALDAMPGKQMAIDAELRAGAIDGDAARARRGALERESQLYGAMDGAMRFVKGDAIAAIVIVVVNLVGGLVIGVGTRGMTAADAVRTYSLLSVGAGLVAQIPSLLVAVASGLLVTRVASAGDRALGDDLGEQLAGSPRALAGAAMLLVGLGLVPGLPLAPFAALGAIAAACAVLAARARPSARAALDEPGAERVRGPRLALRVGRALHARLVERPDDVRATLATTRADASKRAGLELPPLATQRDDELGDTELALAIDDVPVTWLALGTAGAADPIGELRARLPGALAQLAPEILDVDRVAALVEQAAAHSPVVVREVVPRIVALPVLAEIVRQLAREQVPLADLAAILQAVALVPQAPPVTARDVAVVVEHVRGQLRRQISARWAPRGQLAVFTLDSMIEDAVRTAIERRDGAAVLALEPAIAQDIVAAVRGKLGSAGVLLVSSDVRRHLRDLLAPELPDVAILSAHELAPGTAITTTGRVEV
jgi:type III secretion protein V